MKTLKKFIQLIRPDNIYRKRDFLVVDNDKYDDKWGGLLNGTRIVATKCDEFETEEQALEYVEENVTKNGRRFIQIYKLHKEFAEDKE